MTMTNRRGATHKKKPKPKPKFGMAQVVIRVERREAMTIEEVARRITGAVEDNTLGLTLYRVVATVDE